MCKIIVTMKLHHYYNESTQSQLYAGNVSDEELYSYLGAQERGRTKHRSSMRLGGISFYSLSLMCCANLKDAKLATTTLILMHGFLPARN